MNNRRPRVGLVLGAGRVAGLCLHAGVLGAVEEATGWDPRRATVVVGTSAGSIAAAALRAGLSASDLLARCEDREPSERRCRWPVRPPSPLCGGWGATTPYAWLSAIMA